MFKINNSNIPALPSIKMGSAKNFSIKLKPLIVLIGKLALGIFIIPICFAKYRKWVERSITQLHSDQEKKGAYKSADKIIKLPKLSGSNGSDILPDSWWKKLGNFEHDPLLNLSEDSRINRAMQDKQIYNSELSKLDKNHTVKKYPLMGPVNWIPGKFSLWMAGVGLVASYLSQKHHVEGLYVCNTLEAMTQKLNEVLENTLDQRIAFVIPTFSSGTSSLFKPNFPQHKIAILVEKHGDKTKIAILDADTQARPISSKNLPCEDIWDNWNTYGSFNASELALRAIFKTKLPAQAEVFYSHVPREAKYGCETFALRDALAFLKDPNFFGRIQGDQEFIYQGVKVNSLNQLPPAFMITTQYFSSLNFYLTAFPHDQKIPGSSKTLQDYVNKFRVKVAGKDQNHYVTRKTYKYSKVALAILQKSNNSELETILSQTFLT